MWSCVLGIRWYQFVRNDDVRRLMKQPKLTAIIQSRQLTLFGHIMCMDDNADAKRILLASPPADWRRQLGCPRIMWLSTMQHNLKHHHLTLPEVADLAQNHSLWRMMSTYGATQSWVALQKRRRSCDRWNIADLFWRFQWDHWHCFSDTTETVLSRPLKLLPIILQRSMRSRTKCCRLSLTQDNRIIIVIIYTTANCQYIFVATQVKEDPE